MSEDKFVTICEAVMTAMDEWSSQGVFISDMEALVDDLVHKAISEWESAEPSALPIPVSEADAHTIFGAVLNAFDDWHSGGNTFEEMKELAEEFSLKGISDWKDANDLNDEEDDPDADDGCTI